MLKKSLLALTVVALTACGPAPQPPAEPLAPVAPAAAPVVQPATPSVARAAPEPVAPRPAPRPRAAPRPEPEPAPPVVRQVCNDCGVIASVSEERVKGDATAYGTLGGAAAGGLAGAQFGKKSGKILATIGGVVLGGLAGREVEKQVRAKHVFHVAVNMEGGGTRTVTVDDLNGLGVGSKVRVSGETLLPN